MRIHTNTLTLADIHAAVNNLPSVYVTVSRHGSRSHDHAFEVSLEGNGYARNTGNHGADDYEKGATWDEWGVFLAHLFAKDADAMCGSAKYPVYRDAADFHYQTADRFADPESGLPDDTHKRHNWTGGRGVRTCTKCSAEQWNH